MASNPRNRKLMIEQARIRRPPVNTAAAAAANTRRSSGGGNTNLSFSSSSPSPSPAVLAAASAAPPRGTSSSSFSSDLRPGGPKATAAAAAAPPRGTSSSFSSSSDLRPGGPKTTAAAAAAPPRGTSSSSSFSSSSDLRPGGSQITAVPVSSGASFSSSSSSPHPEGVRNAAVAPAAAANRGGDGGGAAEVIPLLERMLEERFRRLEQDLTRYIRESRQTEDGGAAEGAVSRADILSIVRYECSKMIRGESRALEESIREAKKQSSVWICAVASRAGSIVSFPSRTRPGVVLGTFEPGAVLTLAPIGRDDAVEAAADAQPGEDVWMKARVLVGGTLSVSVTHGYVLALSTVAPSAALLSLATSKHSLPCDLPPPPPLPPATPPAGSLPPPRQEDKQEEGGETPEEKITPTATAATVATVAEEEEEEEEGISTSATALASGASRGIARPATGETRPARLLELSPLNIDVAGGSDEMAAAEALSSWPQRGYPLVVPPDSPPAPNLSFEKDTRVAVPFVFKDEEE